MGAWIVSDPYWDPISSHATEAEAAAEASASGGHVIFVPEGTPGRLSEQNYGHWDAFLRAFDRDR